MDDVFARYQAALRAGHQLAADGKFKDALAQYEAAASLAERPLPLDRRGWHAATTGQAQGGARGLRAGARARAGQPRRAERSCRGPARGGPAHRGGHGRSSTWSRCAMARAPGRRCQPRCCTPLSRAETLAIAGEQARDSGQRDAAIDAWLAEAREHAAAQKFDAALDAQMRALALDTGSTRVHLELDAPVLRARLVRRGHPARRLAAPAAGARTQSGGQLRRSIGSSSEYRQQPPTASRADRGRSDAVERRA